MKYDLFQMVKEGRLYEVPKEYFAKEKLLKKDTFGFNIVHYATLFGELDEIPKKFLTLSILNIEGMAGENCFHYAGRHGNLTQIPKELLVEENILKVNKSNHNALDLASASGKLHLVPKKFLSPKYLLVKDDGGNCPLSGSMQQGKYRNDIEKVLAMIPIREWVPYLKELKEVKGKGVANCRIIAEYVEKVEVLQKVKEMPALKI